MFLVTYIYRTASSGNESITRKTFHHLEMAAVYIQGEWYDSFCQINDYPEYWDDEDFGRPMPSREEFSLDAINKARSKKYWFGNLFTPYSRHCALVPNELRLEEVKK